MKGVFHLAERCFVISVLACSIFVAAPDAHGAQIAVVVTDGAMVYEKADFDSQVIGYFDAGRKVQISEKTFGPFFRIRLKQGVLGYISDADVKSEKGGATAAAKPAKGIFDDEEDEDGEKKKKKKRDDDGEIMHRRKPMGQRTSVGLAFGQVMYKELFGKEEPSEAMSFMGLKGSFPAVFMDGPFQMEANLYYSGSAPGYYSKYISGGTPSGRIVIFDLVMDFAIEQFSSGILYLGSGPVITSSTINAEIKGQQQKLEDVQAGASFSLGMGWWFGPVVARGEVKYFFVKAGQFAGFGSLQYDLN